MTVEDIKAKLRAELPALLQQDADFRAWLEDLIRRTAVSAEHFDARFDRVLRELAADREEQARKWDEQTREWREQNRKWDEQNRKWDEQNRKWHEQQRFNEQLLDELRQTRVRQEQAIGALGARWGRAGAWPPRPASGPR